MNVKEFIVHAYPIENEEFLLRFSHLTNYLDRYVASKTGKYERYPKREFLRIIRIKKLLVRKDMDVSDHKRLSNTTLETQVKH
jgi:hypothetical protein